MSQVIEVSLDNRERIVIPRELQSRLKLMPWMTLMVEEGSDGQVCLSNHAEFPLIIDKQGVLVVRAKPVGDLADVTRYERDHCVLELSQRVDS